MAANAKRSGAPILLVPAGTFGRGETKNIFSGTATLSNIIAERIINEDRAWMTFLKHGWTQAARYQSGTGPRLELGGSHEEFLLFCAF